MCRALVWMRDYDHGEGLSEDEAYMALTAAEEDPVFFEDAMKEGSGDIQWMKK